MISSFGQFLNSGAGVGVAPRGVHDLTVGDTDLRPVVLSDIDHYFPLLNDGRVMRYVGLHAGRLIPFDEVREIVNASVNGWVERDYGRWSMFCRLTGEFKGFVGFRNEGGTPEFICIVHERFWGSGVAFAAAKATLDHGFQVHRFAEVLAYCRPQHVRARRFLEKLDADFVREMNFHGVVGAEYRFATSV